jgi:hypothetical protein
MRIVSFIFVLLVAALAGCASPDRRVQADKVSLFALDAAPIKSMRVVLAPSRAPELAMAYRESAAGWNTPLFDERFGTRLAANLQANGVVASFHGASGVKTGAAPADQNSYVMLIALKSFSYSTRNGLQDNDANYTVVVSIYPPGSSKPVVQYEDVMLRAFVGVHNNLADRFTYTFFNLLRDRGQWPAASKTAVGG